MKKIFEPSIARAARAYTGLDQAELAAEAKVASRTIFKLEQDGRVKNDSLEKILDALQKRGVVIMRDPSGHVWGLGFARSLNP